MKQLAIFLLLALPAFGQFNAVTNGAPTQCPGYRTLILDQVNDFVYSCGGDSHGAVTPQPWPVGRITQAGSVLPATCSANPLQTFGLVSGGVTAPYYCQTTNHWVAFGAGGGSAPGGPTNAIQTNANGSTLGGYSALTFDGTTVGLAGNFNLNGNFTALSGIIDFSGMVTAGLLPQKTTSAILATACSGGDSAQATDAANPAASYYLCFGGSAHTGGTWYQLAPASLGTITNGFLPMATPTGMLTDSHLKDNTNALIASLPMQGPSFTATAPNIGVDFTPGDGSGMNCTTSGHTCLYSDVNSPTHALRVVINGVDTGSYTALNPKGRFYDIDGYNYTSTCGLLATMPSNSIVTVHSHILENFTCDPYNAASGLLLHLILDAQSSCYTTDVPWSMSKTADTFDGDRRGRAGGATYHGVCIAPSATYAASHNPYVSTGPSGFTIGAVTSGCSATFLSGTFFIAVTWGPDMNRETGKDSWQEASVALNGTNQCLKVSHPASPPANVTKYHVYVCHQASPSCGSGGELWQADVNIGSDFTLANAAALASGSGTPPSINTTGAFIAAASLASGSASANNVIFGVKVRNLSIDCSQGGLAVSATTGCIGFANFNAEEESILNFVDFNEIPGTVAIYWGLYSIGLGASNSAIEEVELNNGSISNPSIAGIYLDSIETMRGLNKFTITMTGVPSCVFASGSTLAPTSGTAITNGHLEKCTATAGIKLVNFHGFLSNNTCSPSNINPCVSVDANSGVAIAGTRGGSSDAPIADAGTGFTSPRAYEPFYTNSLVAQMVQWVGATPTATLTGMGLTPTIAFQTGSNNKTGRINITAGGGSETATFTASLIFSGTGFGANNVACSFEPVSGPTPWPNNTTHRVSSTGTGHVDSVWVPGGGTGTAFGDGNQVAISYNCDPY